MPEKYRNRDIKKTDYEKILILTLGTGKAPENGEAGYIPTQYIINGKKYQKNGVDVKTNFVAEPIINSFVPDEIFILGTVTSNWYQFYASSITNDNDDKSYLQNSDYKRLLDIKNNNNYGKATDYSELKKLSAEITGIFNRVNNWEKYSCEYKNKKPNIHILLTKYGINEEELKKNYAILKNIEAVLHEDRTYEVAFDITHSFRSLPIYNLIIFNYIRNITKFKLSISHVYYGMVEITRENDDVAPIVDLADIVNILNLTNGVTEFKDTGNAVSLIEMLGETDNIKPILKDFDLATQLNAFNIVKEKLIKLFECTTNTSDVGRYTGVREMIGIALRDRFFAYEHIDTNRLKAMSDADLKFCLTEWFFNQNRIGLGLATGLEALRDMVTPAFMQARGYKSEDERKYRENAESYFIRIAENINNETGHLSDLQKTVLSLGMKLRHYKKIRNTFAHSLSNTDDYDLDNIKQDINQFKTDFRALRQCYNDNRQEFNSLFVSGSGSQSYKPITAKECRVILTASEKCIYANYKKSKNKSYDVYYLSDSVRGKIFGGINGKSYSVTEKAYFLGKYLISNLPQGYEQTQIILLGCRPEQEFVFRLYLENRFNEDETVKIQHLSDTGGLVNYKKLSIFIDEKMYDIFTNKEIDYDEIMELQLLRI